MKLLSPSSALVTWDDQVAESFILHLHLANAFVSENDVTGNNYTFRRLPVASKYRYYVYALFDGRVGRSSDEVIITGCK